MKSLKALGTVVAILGITTAANAKTPVVICTTETPEFYSIMDDKLSATILRGSVLIDIDAKKTVWRGTGGYSRLTAEQRGNRIIITRLDGSGGGIEPINQVEELGSTSIISVTESFGGAAKIVLTMNGSSGSALYVDGNSRQELKFCTSDVSGN